MSKKNKRKSHLYSSQPLKENVKRIILKRCFKFVEEEEPVILGSNIVLNE